MLQRRSRFGLDPQRRCGRLLRRLVAALAPGLGALGAGRRLVAADAFFALARNVGAGQRVAVGIRCRVAGASRASAPFTTCAGRALSVQRFRRRRELVCSLLDRQPAGLRRGNRPCFAVAALAAAPAFAFARRPGFARLAHFPGLAWLPGLPNLTWFPDLARFTHSAFGALLAPGFARFASLAWTAPLAAVAPLAIAAATSFATATATLVAVAPARTRFAFAGWPTVSACR